MVENLGRILPIHFCGRMEEKVEEWKKKWKNGRKCGRMEEKMEEWKKKFKVKLLKIG